MDKETLGQYGWLVVCVIILAIMITLATPFGSVIRGEVEGIVTNFQDTATNALDNIEAENSFSGGGSGGSGSGGGSATLLDGDGAVVDPQSATPFSVRSSAPIDEFIEVKVDGSTVASSNYTVTEGSTIVTFKQDYLATLAEGEHTVAVVSESGTATGTFEITDGAEEEEPVWVDLKFSDLIAEGKLTYTTDESVGGYIYDNGVYGGPFAASVDIALQGYYEIEVFTSSGNPIEFYVDGNLVYESDGSGSFTGNPHFKGEIVSSVRAAIQCNEFDFAVFKKLEGYSGEVPGNNPEPSEPVVTAYTQSDISNSGGKLVAIGKTNPLYVVAAFNDDYTSLTITKNGADSDGKIKNFVAMTDDHPFLADYYDVATVVVEEGITYIGDQTFFHIGSLTPATLSLPASLTGVSSSIYDNSFPGDMTINYAGTIAQYEELFASCTTVGYTVHCADGDVTI